MIITTKDIVETKADILSQVSELSIYSFYIGESVCLGCNINSPLREDKTPSFNIRAGSSGLQWKDFGTGLHGDFIEFVKEKFHLGYFQALKKIESDIPKIKGKSVPYYVFPGIIPKREIRVAKREFNGSDLIFWGQFGIDKPLLDLYEVSALSHYWLKECNKELEFKCVSPTYSYHYGNYKYRLYSPNSKERGYKWLNNADNSVLQGWNQLPEEGGLVVLTSSLKDVMVLRKFGYNAFAAQSESAIIQEESMEYLFRHFKEVKVFLNNDAAGVSASQRYIKRYGLEAVYLPLASGCKDPAEYRSKFGETQSEQMFKLLLKP